MDYSRPDLADRLAAEYVSGLLRGPARRRFEQLLPAHPALRRAVFDWQARLMPMTAEVTPEPPSAALWARIESAIGGPALAPKPGAAAWWQQLGFWRAFSAIGLAASLALAVVLATPGPVRPPIVVVLSAAPPASGAGAAGAAGAAGGDVVPASFVASITADGRAMVTKPINNVNVQADRSLELWSLPSEGAPR